MTLSIGQATADDLTATVDLLDEMDRFYGGHPEQERDRVAVVERLIFGQQPSAYLLLARGDGQVSGLAAYSFLWPAIGVSHSLYLKELYVRESQRRRGIALALMRRLAEIAEATGCTRIEWTTDRDNDEAQRFYKQLGLQVNPAKLFYRVEGAQDLAAARQRWTTQ